MPDSYMEVYENILRIREKNPPRSWPPDLKEAARTVANLLVADHKALFFPLIVYIEPTNACNCNCVICPRRNMTRPVGYMDMAFFKRIVDQVRDLGPSEIRLFNFGEPTLHHELAEMVAYCVENGFQPGIQTNGVNLTVDLIEQLIDAGLKYIGVSVNGLNAEEYATIRPGYDYDRLNTNLALLHRVAAEKQKQLHVHVNAQILKSDCSERKTEIDAYMKHWSRVADTISVSGLSIYDRIAFVKKGAVTESDLKGVDRKPDSEVNCLEPFNRMIIKWDGRATVCCADYDAAYVVGDLKSESLEQVWNSDGMTAVRETVSQDRYSEHPLCRTCPLFYSDQFSLLHRKNPGGEEGG